MLNYTNLSKPTRFFSFIKPSKAFYSLFKSKSPENAFKGGLRECVKKEERKKGKTYTSNTILQFVHKW